MFGFVLSGMMLVIFSNIPCEIRDICEYGSIEDVNMAMKQILSLPVLMVIIPMNIIVITSFNIVGVSFVKYGSAA